MNAPAEMPYADISLADFPKDRPVLKVYAPGSPVPLYFVPGEDDVPALTALGVPRGQIFTGFEVVTRFLEARGGADGRV